MHHQSFIPFMTLATCFVLSVAGCDSGDIGGGNGNSDDNQNVNNNGNGNDFPNDGGIAAFWANDGGDKVAREELRASTNSTSVQNSVWDGNAISIFGARNEVVSFNLVLEAPSDRNVADVGVSFDTLTGPGGATINSEPASGDGVFDWTRRNIELFYVRYLQIKGISSDLAYDDYDERHIPERFRRPWTGPGDGMGGWTDRPDHDKYYPDIAVPLELVGQFDITAVQNQSIWVDVFIPQDATAGQYDGVVQVTEDGTATAEIPVQLTVRDFTLPDEPSAKTMVFLGYEDVNMRYVGEEYPESGSANDATSRLVRDRHFLLAHRHRISLIDNNGDGGEEDRPNDDWLARLDGSLFTPENGYDGPGVGVPNNVFSIGTYGSWSWQGEGEAAMRQHTDAWVQWFEANAPDTDYFLYLTDEPGEDEFPQVEQWARWINDNPGPGSSLRSMCTISIPEARASTPSLDAPTAWARFGITSEWQDAVDELKANPGKSIYMYNGLRPASGSFATEDDGVALRELAWGQYKMGIDRWLYWESTYYNNFQGGTGQTDVFRTAQTFGGEPDPDDARGENAFNYYNGDGVLFYPGTDMVFPNESYDVLGPIASLRLKQWRRGIQDADYLTMAAAIDPQRVAEIVNEIIPTVLWELGVEELNDPSYVLADISWPTDPDAWEAARAELANIIESGQ